MTAPWPDSSTLDLASPENATVSMLDAGLDEGFLRAEVLIDGVCSPTPGPD